MKELKITKEKVLEAAEKCSQAKETLKTLFPEVFKKDLPVFPQTVNVTIGDKSGIEDRNTGAKDYAPNTLWLSHQFHWEIKDAKGGGYLLVVNHKS